MNRNDFVRELSNIVGTKKEARDVLEKFITLIKKSLINDERVTISGFGSFYMRLRKAKKGRNPKTGKEVEIPSRKVVKFKPAKDFSQV